MKKKPTDQLETLSPSFLITFCLEKIGDLMPEIRCCFNHLYIHQGNNYDKKSVLITVDKGILSCLSFIFLGLFFLLNYKTNVFPFIKYLLLNFLLFSISFPLIVTNATREKQTTLIFHRETNLAIKVVMTKQASANRKFLNFFILPVNWSKHHQLLLM